MANLQIRIHKTDGHITDFTQNDAVKIRHILESIRPLNIFTQDRLIITEQDKVTTLPVSKITRIDLAMEQLSEPIFPPGIVDAIELSQSEYAILARTSIMQNQLQQPAGPKQDLVTFFDLEMAGGQQILLTTDLQIHPPNQPHGTADSFPFDRGSLCFQLRTGGVGILNLANLVRLTYFPNPEHILPGAWHANRLTSPPHHTNNRPVTMR